MSGQERTEKATPKRRKEARRKGQIGNTPEIGSWAGLLVATTLLPSMANSAVHSAQDLLSYVRPVAADPDQSTDVALLRTTLIDVARAVLPLGVVVMAVGVTAVLGQGGFTIAPRLWVPKFSRLNPLGGLKRMFGPQGVWQLTKSLLKTAVLAAVAWSVVAGLVPRLAASGSLTLGTVLALATSTTLTLLRATAVAGLVLALADYAVVRRRNNKSLKMTKQEIKDEFRQSEGDPLVKSARRSRALALTRHRMLAAIESADVVLVNPTHVAVALKYDPARGAPRVVAKGADHVAARIRELAEQHRVPMVEDVPLARALYKACDIGQEIPVELFKAVATVLAFLYRLRKRGSAAGLHRLV